jgi:arsenite methyltransferase
MVTSRHNKENLNMSNETKNCCGPACCSDGSAAPGGSTARDSKAVTDAVQSRYGSVAGAGLSSDHDGVRAIATAFGYSADELGSIPAEANMGLSCGNPVASANLKAGEVVVDLGCGGGLDVFLAAQKVGPAGRAIGIDMTSQMIDLARRNAVRANVGNVEFHHATIDRLPLPDASVDVVISNCVINLAPDKSAVFREIARVLKPGGRVAISDIALKRPLPEELAHDVEAYVGCIAGAIRIDRYERELVEAGFEHVQVIDSGADLNAYAKLETRGSASCCAPPAAKEKDRLPLATAEAGCCGGSEVHEGLAHLLLKYDVNDYAASMKIYALKSGD